MIDIKAILEGEIFVSVHPTIIKIVAAPVGCEQVLQLQTNNENEDYNNNLTTHFIFTCKCFHGKHQKKYCAGADFRNSKSSAMSVVVVHGRTRRSHRLCVETKEAR